MTQLWLDNPWLKVVLILTATLLAYWLMGLLTRAISRRIQALDQEEGSELDKRTKTIFGVIRSTGLVLILATAFLMVLSELGVSIVPLLASVGIVGLAFGLGAQSLVKDMLNGLFILIENQYTVGDAVEVAGVSGTVEDLTLRTTEVRDAYGTLHIIPNGEIRIVSNKSRDWSLALADVRIPYDADVDTAIEVLGQVAKAMEVDEGVRSLLIDTAVVTGVEGLDDWAVRLRVFVKTEPNQHLEVQRYLRRQIHRFFGQHGIALASPRQDILLRHVQEPETAGAGVGQPGQSA